MKVSKDRQAERGLFVDQGMLLEGGEWNDLGARDFCPALAPTGNCEQKLICMR